MSVVDVVATRAISQEPVDQLPAGCFQSGAPFPYSESTSSSILIYLAVAGSVFPVRVSEFDPVASVELSIQASEANKKKDNKLVFEGREFAEIETLLSESGVSGDVLHLVLPLCYLLVILIRTARGKVFEFHVEHLKQQVSHIKRGISDQDILEEYSDVIHLLVQKEAANVRAKNVEEHSEVSIITAFSDERVDGFMKLQANGREARSPNSHFYLDWCSGSPLMMPSYILEMVGAVYDGLKAGHSPIITSEGSGGSYFMPDSSGHNACVFKPMDEEPLAINNPRGQPVSSDGEGLKQGTKVGEGAVREVVAWLLDHPKVGPRYFKRKEKGFAGVPATILVKCLHRGFNYPCGFDATMKNVKIGSIQKFVENYGNCEDINPKAFMVYEVHKISVLDIRMANTDRHAGNILTTRGEDGDGKAVLVPIDHGYCLPQNFKDCTFEWLYWPQAHVPYSSDTIEYIRSLNAEEDIDHLTFCGWDMPIECARTLRISTMLLKKGVERGLTPFAIGSIMCRETLHKESMIEEIVRQAEDHVLPGMSEDAFIDTVSDIMDHTLNNLRTLSPEISK